MNFKNIVASAKQTARIAKLKIKHHSPTILTVAGCCGFVGTVVLACKATTKLNAVVEAANKEIAKCEAFAEACPEGNEEISAKEVALAPRGAKIRKAYNIGKLYATTALLGGASIFMVLFAHSIMSKRYSAMAAYAAATLASYNSYRNRVSERFGSEVENELYYDIKKEIIETVDPETGEVSTEEVTVSTDNIPNRFWFDETCRGYTNDPKFNLDMLLAYEDELNKLFESKKFYTGNEILSKCGIERQREFAEIGKVYDPNGGDHQIDFGLKSNTKEVRDFLNGYTAKVPLTFNFDCNVFDAISKSKKKENK